MPKISGIENITTRQKLVDYILNAQLADGGWNLNVSDPTAKDFETGKVTLKSDPDMTGMALTALAPYKSQTKVKIAINKAVTALSKSQNADGRHIKIFFH